MATLQKHDLTQATGITAEVVLEQGKFYEAKDFRKVQTGLSSAARELRALTRYGTLLGRLGEQLSHEQRELLSNAAALLDSVKYNVEHAKERKAREEKAAAKLREQRERQAKQIVSQLFDLPLQTVEQQIEVLKLYIVTRQVLIGSMLDRDGSLRERMQTPAPKWQSSEAAWRISHVSGLISDLKYSVGCHLVHRDLTPTARLEEFQNQLAQGKEAALATPSAEQTIKVWTEALQQAAFVKGLLPEKAPSLGGSA